MDIFLHDMFFYLLEPKDLSRLAMTSTYFWSIASMIEKYMPVWLMRGRPWHASLIWYVQIQLNNGHVVQYSLKNLIALTTHTCTSCFQRFENGYLNDHGIMIHASCLSFPGRRPH